MDEATEITFDPADPVASRTEALTGFIAGLVGVSDAIMELGLEHIRVVTRSIDIQYPQPKLAAIDGGKKRAP